MSWRYWTRSVTAAEVGSMFMHPSPNHGEHLAIQFKVLTGGCHEAGHRTRSWNLVQTRPGSLHDETYMQAGAVTPLCKRCFGEEHTMGRNINLHVFR